MSSGAPPQDAKIGVTPSDVEHRRQDGPAVWTISQTIEIKPLLSLGFRHEFSMRWSGVAEITNYFLSALGSITTVTVGIRYDL